MSAFNVLADDAPFATPAAAIATRPSAHHGLVRGAAASHHPMASNSYGGSVIAAPAPSRSMMPTIQPISMPMAPRPSGGLAMPSMMPTSPAPMPMRPSNVLATSSGPSRRLRDSDLEFDPRALWEDFKPQLLCCGQEMNLAYQDANNMTKPEGGPGLLEFLFHALCQTCEAEFHLSAVKAIPRDQLPQS